ncbi:phosphonoacetaldehyde reductase [Oceanicoccus sp. KOV_DT_Chl]|uniref:phosphonoacetaldehyde reductase n=1 Tax=Oceanicoccus sp. KOV_DT_Chl TaxID=1904639 RepID=UPI000C7D17C6|nr:phosphonoacetaldehyde reductase [Oceanicoccus sp. KOV_DT_Chl]
MQQEFLGRGSSSNIVDVLTTLNAKRILLVTGKDSYSSCGAKAVFSQLLAPYQVSTFDNFSPNPEFSEALEGTKLCQQINADVIIAVGGGSAIDIAKSIAAFTAVPGGELELATGKSKLESVTLPVIIIPTTAGTGSESTHFAVIYVDGKKYSLASPFLLPAIAILDPQFTDALPKYITACTGFDALCQATESFWATGATTESRNFAKQAITLLMQNLRKVVNDPDKESRENLLRAANFAGKAINISKTTAPHALSYTITSLFGIPHGHAVAMTLGAFFPHHDRANETLLSAGVTDEEFTQTRTELLQLLGVDSGNAAKSLWYTLMADCGLNLYLGDHHIANSPDIKTIIAGINMERLGNHPVQLNTSELVDLLKSIPTH